MAKAVLINTQPQKLSSIKNKNYFSTKISESNPKAKITGTIPFRVKFTNIGIPGYGPNNPAPIGLAIIGFNNYIL